MRPLASSVPLALSVSLALASLTCGLAACDAASAPDARPLSHEAYVWQRAWTGTVRAAVAEVPAELSGLRVLALEVERPRADAASGADEPGQRPGRTLTQRLIWPDIDARALARSGRPITAVVRIGGSRPVADLSLQPLWQRIAAWQDAGVAVVGVEIDHDCATAALADYAAWLRAWQPPAHLRRSITALPTWAGSPALSQVAAAVDELVVQVHAIRAPQLFAARRARLWIEEFARAVGDRPLRVALPTYRAEVGGALLAAEPDDVAAFVRELERAPVANVEGIVWFRLPVETDVATWPARTLQAVIAGRPLAADIHVALVERGPQLFDIVLDNRGTRTGAWPHLALGGDIEAADPSNGYTRAGQTRWLAPPENVVRAGATTVVGWVRGRNLTIEAN